MNKHSQIEIKNLRAIKMFGETDNMNDGVFHIILSVPQNIVMTLNNILEELNIDQVARGVKVGFVALD